MKRFFLALLALPSLVFAEDTLSGGDFDLDANLTCNELDDYVTGAPGWDAIGSTSMSQSGYINISASGNQARYPLDNNLGNNFKLNQGTQAGAPFNPSSYVCPGGIGPTGGLWCYNSVGCPSLPPTNPTYAQYCRRWRFDDNSNLGDSLRNCQKKTDQNLKDNCTGIKLLGKCWKFKYNCIISSLICQNCGKDINGNPNPPCDKGCNSYNEADPNDSTDECGGNGCCTGCCEKIPLINLSCPTQDLPPPVAIPTPFAAGVCNQNQIKPCTSCGGVQFTIIKDWVQCRLEGIAAVLGVIKFDFYNDWVNGSLYLPLVKRKYKTKSRKKKFGQIKKDKFCDFNCFDGQNDEYLSDPTSDTIGGNSERRHDAEHGKPLYVEIEDSNLGFTQFQNIRGHAHHQNRCNSNRLVERKEFNKKTTDCVSVSPVETVGDQGVVIGEQTPNPCGSPGSEINNCDSGCQGGVAGCSAFCGCSEHKGYNEHVLLNGIKGKSITHQ